MGEHLLDSPIKPRAKDGKIGHFINDIIIDIRFSLKLFIKNIDILKKKSQGLFQPRYFYT